MGQLRPILFVFPRPKWTPITTTYFFPPIPTTPNACLHQPSAQSAYPATVIGLGSIFGLQHHDKNGLRLALEHPYKVRVALRRFVRARAEPRPVNLIPQWTPVG
jgi:hypothetical protein